MKEHMDETNKTTIAKATGLRQGNGQKVLGGDNEGAEGGVNNILL